MFGVPPPTKTQPFNKERDRGPGAGQEEGQVWGRGVGRTVNKGLSLAARNIWHSWLPTKGRSRRGNKQLGWSVHHNYSFSDQIQSTESQKRPWWEDPEFTPQCGKCSG